MAFPGTYTTFKTVAPIAYHAVPSEGSSNVTGSCTTCGSPPAGGEPQVVQEPVTTRKSTRPNPSPSPIPYSGLSLQPGQAQPKSRPSSSAIRTRPPGLC